MTLGCETTTRRSTELEAERARNFMRSFQLDEEAAELRERYGGEFGQRCLLARRLIERGVRFIEVSHNLNFLNGAGWDVHNGGILQAARADSGNGHCRAALILDLEPKRMLDKTLIVDHDANSAVRRNSTAAADAVIRAGPSLACWPAAA